MLQYWHFYTLLVLIYIKKKYCRKSRYIQSTVEYLTEHMTIHTWQSRNTLLIFILDVNMYFDSTECISFLISLCVRLKSSFYCAHISKNCDQHHYVKVSKFQKQMSCSQHKTEQNHFIISALRIWNGSNTKK